MKGRYQGSCLCQSVLFVMEGEFDSFFLCHCHYCQKDTGSAHAANLFAGKGELIWEQGAECVTTFRLPGTRHVKSFCSNCGSALPFAGTETGPVVVPAGSLDSHVTLRPDARLFLASRAEWVNRLEEIPGFDRLPE